jgi:pyridoxine/pyridoxamine 5'-phosphate oxidase
MKRLAVVFVLPAVLWAADCTKLEAEFADLDASFRMAKTWKTPSKRYDYYYRYIVKGSELMAWCRNDRRNYRYAEIVRKLRAAEQQRASLRQSVIEEFWRTYDVKPVVREVYQTCTY